MNPITTVRLQSLSSADQAQVPFTAGHSFVQGHLMPTDGLAADKLPLQVDVKALHADGSVRHAIISGVYPKLKAGETASLPLTKAKPLGGAVGDLSAIAGTDAKVTLAIGGEGYSASLAGADVESITTWLAGPVVVEGFVNAPLKNAQGVVHPVLQVRFGVRYYQAIKQARIEVIVENCKTWVSGHKFTYDAEFTVGSKVAYSVKGLTHYHHSRWHRYGWTSTAPQVHIMHDTAYLIATKAVSNYDQTLRVSESILSEMSNYLTDENTGPMKIGTSLRNMGTTGGRGDIGPLPDNAVIYLLSMDKRAGDVMMANADGSGSWSVHYRDEKTGYPLRTDNEVNKDVTLHLNYSDRGPLPVPRTATDQDGEIEYFEDPAHEPSLSYLPYLLTGEQYYLEELHFWTVFNVLGTAPGNHGYGKGLVRWHQVRGQAWSLRTLGHAAYITPDDSPMKAYFNWQLNNNLDFYYSAYVVGNPNKLGVYDGSGENAFYTDHSAPWQDDFFTWSFGYLSELGFQKADPILKWKAKYSVGRMTAPGYCWIQAAAYQLKFRDDDSSPIYDTFAKLYQVNFDVDPLPNENGYVKPNPLGKYFDQPCGSKAQADWLGAANGYEWIVGRMTGYADSVLGYPANMTPALAVAADSGVENSAKAWLIFDARTMKPDYSRNPQWNIVPRTIERATPVQYTPPASPAPSAGQASLAVGQKPADGVVGEWIKVGDENGRIKLENGSYVRYGVTGKAYRYAQVKGEFTATNDAFGGDPVPNIVKVVEAFKVSPPKQPGKLKLGSNSKLSKLNVTITVFDPYALKEVKVLSQTMNSSGSATLSDSTFTIGQMYGVRVEDAKGNLLDTKLPILKAVK